jgi:hypothetical protein
VAWSKEKDVTERAKLCRGSFEFWVLSFELTEINRRGRRGRGGERLRVKRVKLCKVGGGFISD